MLNRHISPDVTDNSVTWRRVCRLDTNVLV